MIENVDRTLGEHTALEVEWDSIRFCLKYDIIEKCNNSNIGLINVLILD